MLEVSPGTRTDHTLQLPDGRTLGYADYGIPGGHPVFYFHGHPGARLEARFLADAAAHNGLRLIGVDRPGMGLSSFQAHRRLLDWPDDVVALADHLHLDRFAVVGLSAGAPYALACAYKIPRRLTACGLIAGVGLAGRVLSFLALWLPWLLLPVVRRFFRDIAHARTALTWASRRWAAPDRTTLLRPGIRDLLAASIVEGLRPGARGPAYDGMLVGRPWGFPLKEIGFPALYLWHGELDKEVPVAMGRTVAEQLAQCEATFYPGDGHLSLIVNHAEDIVKALKGER